MDSLERQAHQEIQADLEKEVVDLKMKMSAMKEAGEKLCEVVHLHWGACDEIDAWDKATE